MSQSIDSYADLLPILDSVVETRVGKRILRISKGSAINMRQRVYQLRLLDRKQNREIYEKGHPQHGTSPYDPISVEINDLGEVGWGVDIRYGAPMVVVDLD